MTNPPRKKGTAAETAVLRWLHDRGRRRAHRLAPQGAQDRGDIGGVTACGDDNCHTHPLVIEVKAHKDLARAVNEGLAELAVEKANAGAEAGVLVLKRRGVTDPGLWLAVRLVRDDPELGVVS